jgi:hypothetical protein
MVILTREQKKKVQEIVRVLELPEPDVGAWSPETFSRFLQFCWAHMPLMKNSKKVRMEVAYLKKNGIDVDLSKFRNLAELESWADEKFWFEIVFRGQNPPWPFVPSTRGSYREAARKFDEGRFVKTREAFLVRGGKPSIAFRVWESVEKLKKVTLKFIRRD